MCVCACVHDPFHLFPRQLKSRGMVESSLPDKGKNCGASGGDASKEGGRKRSASLMSGGGVR